MAYSKKAQSTYDKKIVQFKTKYSLSELQDGERVKAYLEQTGQSANSYIKQLIKADLDAKGFNVNNATIIDMKSLESNNDADNT
ncbi:hypothetical protein [Thomasclavelia cocleata]|jgi:hypothetical protein|uniref:hypothetical protein n=1 Tax=Thomasclavelia cocleata TaxID=69824 RepID=UPI002558019F|nr:hypothetical protein [Thomasclavelia cocleata]